MHTFGIGAVADMPNLSVAILGLDFWDRFRCDPIAEPRLLAAVRDKLGPQVETLRSPPFVAPTSTNVYDEWARVGVPVAIFPRWLRCTRRQCQQLGPVTAAYFQLDAHPYRPERSRMVHTCTNGSIRKQPTAVPARFVLACEEGHLDDFPWMYFAHKGVEPPPGEDVHTLKFVETGTSGEAANVLIRCTCEQGRSMAEAIGPANAAQNLPACRGRHPHLGTFEECGRPVRALALGATNAWFPMLIKAFTLPVADDPLENALAEEDFSVLKSLTAIPQEQARSIMGGMAFWPRVEHHGFDAVWKAIHRRVAELAVTEPSGNGDVDLAGPEWRVFTQQDVIELEELTTKRVANMARLHETAPYLQDVVLVPRLREVSALYGFTRIDAPEFDVLTTDSARVAPLSVEAPTWVPCAEQRGEGIFLRFDENEISAWEARPEVQARAKELRAGHERWRADRRLEPEEWPGIRYVLLHSFAHALIREFALESGYSAAGIAERVYARGGDEPMAGVLLYTAAADSEGTLGGLVALGESPARLGTLIKQAVEAARLCSSDPLCAEHAPTDQARLHGAACHACLFAAETSCHRGNHYLDRALVVDTVLGGLAGVGLVA
ncbi:hypothetical protein DEF23_02165 [Marinitenerispora sediminis]|uniref:MrfA-like Zn-binding domain-containing protein n=2 Tax=Marinitenerispora sediminis TaxID=1931232 RepID=A0A368TBL7_9ACTN|nr:hypothetical protein DEF28_00350 [Marinitenerispora sediminis]RCV61471.1 hypothetical protein DEF23_02165 [Marinitenerispora sediminis]RCV62554.1 hypothetical protein DEF24_00700 [Marinitenerispora sediminis]